MRTYGRDYNADGTYQWVEVTTDANGYNDAVYVTTLIQVLKLVLGESPFWANYGIPAGQSVLQQVPPDFYVARTQQQFSPFFANLAIAKLSSNPPTYQVNILTHQGAVMQFEILV